MKQLTNEEIQQKLSDGSLGKEPSDQKISEHMQQYDESYYSARERLREDTTGGKPPSGYKSWGDYWKSY